MKIPKKEDGQGLVEYALLLVLVAIVIIAILTILGSQVNLVFAKVVAGLNGQVITGVGTEAVVSGYDKSVSGTTTCTVEVSDISFIGLQDGEILENGTVSLAITFGGNSPSVQQGSTGSNGIGRLAGPYSGSGPCPLSVSVLGN